MFDKFEKFKNNVLQLNSLGGLGFVAIGAALFFAVLTPTLTLILSIGLIGYGAWLVTKE